jgi:hypothetical protein
MRSGDKALWKSMLLRAPGEAASADVPRAERLAALYRFQNGEAPAGRHFYDPDLKAVVTDPGQVDWTAFPVIDALEAVTRDELHRLRALLRAEPGRAELGSKPATPTPPNGLVWGVDLRCAPTTEA